MKQILRYSLIALLAIFGMSNVFAEDADVVIDFSGSEDVWKIGTTKLMDTQSFTNGDYTITLTGTSGGGYRWYDSGNIILGKQGATLQLPAFNFDVQRIDVVGTSGASAAVKQNIFVGDDAVSTETTGAKDVTNSYVIDEGKQTAGTIYTLKVTSNHNTQITKILIYKTGSSSKQQAGLSWGKASATVTIGADDNIFPTLSNPHELSINYSTSDQTVATIDQSGVITLVGSGKCDVIAEFEGNDQYEAQTVKYTLTVNVYKNFVKATTIESGKNYLLVVNLGENGLKAAKRITGSYGNLLVETATEQEGKISFITDNAFTFTSTENGWTIMQNDGKYLYQSGDYNNFNVSTQPTSAQYFDVEAQENGTFKITNKEKGKFVQYVPANSNIGCFADAQEGAILPMLYVEEAVETKYTITVTNTEHGNITLDKYEAAAGEKVNVTGMTTNPGWQMEPPTITDANGNAVEIQGGDGGYYIIMPASNVTIALNFTQLFIITIADYDNNMGDVTGVSFNKENNPIYTKANKNVQFKVEAKEGYQIESVTVVDEDNNPISVGPDENKIYQFQMPAKNVTITAVFSAITWTVAGTQPLTDNTWAPSDTNADMTSTDGVNFTYVKEDIVLEAATNYEFKVVKNHAWGEEYPTENYSFTVPETAKYKVTITFNASTKDVGCEAVKTGEAGPVTHTWSVVGSLVGGWENDVDMTKGDDGLYKAVIENVAKATDPYEFKVRADHDWGINYPASNYKVTVDQDGSTVTVTFNEETHEVKATVTSTTGINTAKIVDMNNAQIYNIAGQKVTSSYKGLVIVNGKKFVVK